MIHFFCDHDNISHKDPDFLKVTAETNNTKKW